MSSPFYGLLRISRPRETGLRKFTFAALPKIPAHQAGSRQIISSAVAMDTPPPPQRVARPSVLPRFFMA